MANVLEIPPAFDPSTQVIAPVGPSYSLPAIVDDAAGVYVDLNLGDVNTGWQFGDDCSGCVSAIHETTVDAFVLVEYFPDRDCSLPGVDGPGGSAETEINALVARGAMLGELFPTWLLDDLGLDAEQPAVFDFWTLACLGYTIVPITIPSRPCPPGFFLMMGRCLPGPGTKCKC